MDWVGLNQVVSDRVTSPSVQSTSAACLNFPPLEYCAPVHFNPSLLSDHHLCYGALYCAVLCCAVLCCAMEMILFTVLIKVIYIMWVLCHISVHYYTVDCDWWKGKYEVVGCHRSYCMQKQKGCRSGCPVCLQCSNIITIMMIMATIRFNFPVLYRNGLGRVKSSCLRSSYESVCSVDKCCMLKFSATRVLRSCAFQSLTALWSSSVLWCTVLCCAVLCCAVLCNGDDTFYSAYQGYLHYVGTVSHISALLYGRLWLMKREIRGGRLSS